MGLSLSKLVDETRTFNVKFESGDLSVTYKPSTLSAGAMKKLAETVDDDDPNGFAIMFCSTVTAWDLEGPLGEGKNAVKAGQPVPLDPELVAFVPTATLRYIMEEIAEDASPKRSKRGSSRR